MISYYYIEENFYKSQRIGDDLNNVIIYYFCQLINNHQDLVIGFTFLIYND